MEIGGSFPGLKRPWREAYRSRQSRAKVKNELSYTSVTLNVYMNQSNFTMPKQV